jgi:putative chitinase
MITTARVLSLLAGRCTRERALTYGAPLASAMEEFGITPSLHVAMFLANVLAETGALRMVEENLNYSADRLMAVWPARFAPDGRLAAQYARQPERIANYVYANREGNGDVASGDGWRFRGAGLHQLTFKNNQLACAKHFGIPPSKIGEWLRTPEGASRSAAWFWTVAGCSKHADAGDFDGVCDTINRGRKTKPEGDSIGFPARLDAFNYCRKELQC